MTLTNKEQWSEAQQTCERIGIIIVIISVLIAGSEVIIIGVSVKDVAIVTISEYNSMSSSNPEVFKY